MIDKTDLRVDVYTQGFAKAAVRIIHMPTGTVATSDKLRSSQENYDEALRQLCERLNQQ